MKIYEANQSPFYKLRSKKKLAKLLYTSLSALEKMSRNTDAYRVFTIDQGKKTREIQSPKPGLEKTHRRLFHLLKCIKTPEYLHSGTKGRSYITNATVHKDASQVVTLDIKSFYPSTKGWHIFAYFRKTLLCSPDVSHLLTQLCTYNDHVPTGSCLSQQIAYLAHSKMFNDIYDYCNSQNCEFTCYVDDLTISGKDLSSKNLYEIRGFLYKRSLRSPKRKENIYSHTQNKLVTGVLIKKENLHIQNIKHLKYKSLLDQYRNSVNPDEKLKVLNSLIGMASSFSCIKPSFKSNLQILIKERHKLSLAA